MHQPHPNYQAPQTYGALQGRGLRQVQAGQTPSLLKAGLGEELPHPTLRQPRWRLPAPHTPQRVYVAEPLPAWSSLQPSLLQPPPQPAVDGVSREPSEFPTLWPHSQC